MPEDSNEDLFSNFLNGDESPITGSTFDLEEGTVEMARNTSTSDRERNVRLAGSDFLSHYDGKRNPYTGETLNIGDTDPKEINEKYPYQFSGLLWSQSDYQRVLTDIDNGELPYEQFRDLVAALCDQLQRPMLSEEFLHRFYRENENPQEALESYLLTSMLHIDERTVALVEKICSEFQVNNEVTEAWKKVFEKLHGLVTVNEYIDSLIQQFPELQHVQQWQQVQKIFFSIRHGLIFTRLFQSGMGEGIDKSTEYSLSDAIMNEIVQRAQSR